MKENVLILIGGAPTTGKSTLAQKISEEYKIPWISTDQLRHTVQEILKGQEEKYPNLFNDVDENVSAEIFLNKFSPKEVAELEIKQSQATFFVIKTFIEKSYPWKSFILEGVNILPELVEQIKFSGKIIPIFLVDEDVDRARKVIFDRGLWGPAKSYSDTVKEKEVEWVFEFSKKLKELCTERGISCFEVTKSDEDTHEIFRYIKQKLNG